MLPTSFDSLPDLARLPYFDVVGGTRLRLVDDTVGPIIDSHTHLAMGWFRSLQVDLHAETPRTAYYLPISLPIDLDVYSNENLDAESMWRMKVDLSLLGLTSWGMRTTHTAPNLLRDMDDLGIATSIVLPFDLPVGSSNAEATLDAVADYERLVGFGSVHPRQKNLDDALRRQKQQGAAGIKLHPNGQFFSPDSPRCVHLCGRCAAAGLPVLFHCGPVGIEPKAARERCQVHRYESTIAENPETTFILGHSGALQFDEAVRFAERYPNTYFELSCLGLPSLRHVLETVPPDRVLYGTDWPFYHQALTLARVLIATEGSTDLRRAVLFENAAALMGITSIEH